jgi:hypothetical protein
MTASGQWEKETSEDSSTFLVWVVVQVWGMGACRSSTTCSGVRFARAVATCALAAIALLFIYYGYPSASLRDTRYFGARHREAAWSTVLDSHTVTTK